MYTNKRVLLVAGGGTLGTYTAEELLRRGCRVDIICPEEKKTENPRLRFIRGYATEGLLCELFSQVHYDGIVNFLHYKTVEEYRPHHELLIKNTDHLIFLSSYRVYADEQHPITEDAPRLTEIVKDEEFFVTEDYAVPKCRCEDFLRSECSGQRWTIVRPVISFSALRFDLLVYSGSDISRHLEADRPLIMPESVRDLCAGIDWAGNSGKLIAGLLFKPETIGEAYTVSSAQNMTWGEVAGIYEELMGVRIEWRDESQLAESYPLILGEKRWLWKYDRRFDRRIENSKILAATGLKKSDFLSIRDGLEIELKRDKM